MSTDDLSAPLGVSQPEPKAPPRFSTGQISLAAVCAVVVALAGWAALKSERFGGEPHSFSKIDRSIQTATARTPAASATTEAAPQPDPLTASKSRETASELEDSAGVKVMRGRGGSAPGAVVIRVPDAPVATGRLAPAPDKRLVEKGKHGPLPKVGADGARPRDVYARPYDTAKLRGTPVIAVVVTGLGIGAGVTVEAIIKLPADISLAFAPYGNDLEKQTERARDNGHEVLLQVPLEPFDYPDNDPGPQTLLAESPEAQNIDRLHWLMSRFQGYVGLTNFMGAKFSSSRAALKPLVTEAAKRGLLFVDDGSSGRSQIEPVAAAAGLPALKGNVVLDGLDKAGDIDAALARAEATARSSGKAIVVGPALPLTIERINRWSRALEAKGILLVPVSALIQTGRS